MLEINNFGWNWLTFSVIGALATLIFGFIGIIVQGIKIWRQKSGESINILMISYGVLFFGAGAIYGYSIQSLMMIIGGVRVFLTIPVIIGLWKYKGFKLHDYLVQIAIIVLLGLLSVSSTKDTFYFAITIGAILTFLPQPYEILKKGRGNVSLTMLLSMLIGTSFWSIYSFAINDWVLMIFNPVMLLAVTVTIILWIVKPKTAEITNLEQEKN